MNGLILVMIIPIVLTALNKISVDNLYLIEGEWHLWGDVGSYKLTAYLWLLMLRSYPVLFAVVLYNLSSGIIKSMSLAYLVILVWFLIEFILAYNVPSSIPKIIAWPVIVGVLEWRRHVV